MRIFLRRSVLLIACCLLVLSTTLNILLPSGTARAAFEPSSPANDIEDITERWLFYRGMRACLASGFSNEGTKRSASTINDGKWDPGEDKKGFGYLAPGMDGADDNDGSVNCDDGNVFVDGAKAFGFADAKELLCTMYDKIPEVTDSNRDNYITMNGSGGCKNATEFTFKNGNDKGGVFQQALTRALDTTGKRPAFRLQDNDEKPMLYVIGKRSLEVFCGDGTSLASGIKPIENGKDQVIVDVVDETGKLAQNNKVYDLTGDRDQDSNVHDVVYDANRDNKNTPKWDNNDNGAHDYHCHEMAVLTTKYSNDYSLYIIDSYNKQAAAYAKSQFKATAGLDKATFDRAADQCIDFLRSYAESDATKKIKLKLADPMPTKDRLPTLKQCLSSILPKKYDKAIDLIDETTNEEESDALEGEEEDASTSCAIDGIGWMICPVLLFMADMNDRAYSFISSGFLEFDTGLSNDDGTRAAWNAFKDIANVIFVIFFLMIIYSQITGGGFTNYGIKRMLPRVIVAAILVNVSLILCQIAVDISNIIGANIVAFLQGPAIPTTPGGTEAIDGPFGGSAWHDIVAATLIAGVVGIALVLIVSIGLPALLVLALLVLALIMRKVVILLLIVISPLAFVAYLLPNTEDWFKKWWKLFYTMLMVYPIIGLVFGGSALAARIIAGNPDNIMQITALGVSVIPLFAIPVILKTSMAGLGSIGAKISGGISRAQGSASGNIKKGRSGEALAAFGARRQQRKVDRRLGNGRLASWGNDARRSETKRGKVAARIGSLGSSFDKTRAGSYLGGDRGAASAVYEQNKLNNEAVERSMALLENNDTKDVIRLAQEQLQDAHKRGDVTAARAATRVLASKTGGRGIEALHKTLRDIEDTDGGLHSGISESVKHEVNGAGLKGKDRALDRWSRGEATTTKWGTEGANLGAHDSSLNTTAGLNEAELAGHSVERLGSMPIDKDAAARVVAAHEKGTVHLDGKKLEIFRGAAGLPPTP